MRVIAEVHLGPGPNLQNLWKGRLNCDMICDIVVGACLNIVIVAKVNIFLGK